MATFTRLARAHAASTNSNDATTAAIDTTGADLLVIHCSFAISGGVSPTISDSKGNTWTGLTAQQDGNDAGSRWWYCLNPASVGSGHTATASHAGSMPVVEFIAYSGAKNASVVDYETGVVIETTTPTSYLSPRYTNSLILAGIGAQDLTSGVTPPSGMTELHDVPFTSGQNRASAVAEEIQTSIVGRRVRWTLGGSDRTASSCVVFLSEDSEAPVPFYVGSTSGASDNGTSGNWTLPSDWAAEDLAIFWWCAPLKTVTPPATVTEKHNTVPVSGGVGGNSLRLFIGYRWLESGDTTFAWTASSSANACTLWGVDVFRNAGSGSGDPFAAESGDIVADGGVSDPDTPAVTPVHNNSLIWTIFAKPNNLLNNFAPVAPTNYRLTYSGQSSTVGFDGAAFPAIRILSGGAGVSENPSAFDVDHEISDEINVLWTAAISPGVPIRGSAVFGENTTVTATRAVAFGLDGNTNTHGQAGELKIFGDFEVTGDAVFGDDVSVAGDLTVTGTATLGSLSVSDLSALKTSILHAIVTASGEVVVDSDGHVVFT